MKEKIFGAVLLFWALFFILPGYVASAQEDVNDYVMVDMKTGEEQIIDLSSGQYSNAEKFVSQPLFPNQNEEKAITDCDSKDPGKYT